MEGLLMYWNNVVAHTSNLAVWRDSTESLIYYIVILDHNVVESHSWALFPGRPTQARAI